MQSFLPSSAICVETNARRERVGVRGLSENETVPRACPRPVWRIRVGVVRFRGGDAFENEPAALAWRAAGRGSRPSSRAGFYLNLNAFFIELRAFVKKPWLFLGATRLNG